MLLICPVRPGDDNPELRYALRSWDANLHLDGGLELMTVGHKPSWLEPDQHVEGNRYPSVAWAVWDNVMLASDAANTFESALYMNDDFFCLDPVGEVLPVKRNESLADHRARFNSGAGHWWTQSLDLTASWLAGEGILHPDSWEVHRPLLASPGGMMLHLSTWPESNDSVPPQWRTLYGNLSGARAYPVADCKLGRGIDGVGTPWVSTSDQSWRIYRRALTERFGKPSRWEN